MQYLQSPLCKNLIACACACGERVCACACAWLSVWGPDEQIFASPARAFWWQQFLEFLDKSCKYEIEALNAVHHVGSDLKIRLGMLCFQEF